MSAKLPTFNPNNTYLPGMMVVDTGVVFYCIVANAGIATSNATYWTNLLDLLVTLSPTDLSVAALTDLTMAGSPVVPDYAIQAITDTGPFGFVTADEAETVLTVIRNLQLRVTILETALTAVGIVA